MTSPVAGGKIQETDIGRYRSTRGLDYESVPWKLWEKSKKLFWDPADLDFSQDAIDWQEMTEEERTLVALSARGFMVGEEAVTLDIVPLLRCMSDLGRLEDTMYLAMFAMEEAKHTEMFRRWFDAVGMDPASLDDLVRAQQAALGGRRPGIFDGALPRVMRRLDTDQSPQAILDASIIYNQLVEGVMAIAGYQHWDETFKRLGKLPRAPGGNEADPAGRAAPHRLRHLPRAARPRGEPRALGVAGAALGEAHRRLRRRGRRARVGKPSVARCRPPDGRTARGRRNHGTVPAAEQAPARGARRRPHDERHRGGHERHRGVRAGRTPARANRRPSGLPVAGLDRGLRRRGLG